MWRRRAFGSRYSKGGNQVLVVRRSFLLLRPQFLPDQSTNDSYQAGSNSPLLPWQVQLLFAFLLMLAGALLFIGGLGLREQRERGRLLVVASVWTGISYAILWPIAAAIMVYNDRGRLASKFVMVAAAGLGALIWISLFRLALHYFQSAGVRRLCSPLTSPNPPLTADR